MFYQYLLSLKSISYRVFFSIIFLLNLHAHAATDFTQLPSKQFNVLLFTKTQGWHHKAIPTGVKALQTLSDKHHFNLIWHEESRFATHAKCFSYDGGVRKTSVVFKLVERLKRWS